VTGRERIHKAMLLEETDRTPWVPFVGCHGAALLGLSAEEYLKSADRVVEGVQKALDTYTPDGVCVMFDLQIEAEVLGCTLAWAAENPPAVAGHVLADGEQTLENLRVPGPEAGRIGLSLEAARRLREANPDVALYGLITGPFTLALHLQGTDIFMKMYDDEDYVHRLMAFCGQVSEAMAGYYLDAGCDVVAVVDPMTSQIGPDQFTQFVSPYITPVFEHIRGRGGLGSFFVCGHAQQNVPVMCDCKPHNISVDENIPLAFVRDTCLARGVSFGGNLQLTTVLLLGRPEDAQRNAVECLEVGDGKGFILAPGCDLPYAVPPENLRAVSNVVADPYQRDVAKTLARGESAADLLDLSEYGQADKVIVDIVTLDSEACAPCQYMVESVRKIAPEFEGIVEWREHKIKYRESLVFMTSLMVHNVPTICIDGEIRFVSRIPSREELVRAIQERILEKLRVKIQRKRASIFILGAGEKAELLAANARKAVTELGAEVSIESVTDERQILAFGVSPSLTPAAVVAKYQVRSTAHAPAPAIIKEWIKDVL